MLKIRNIIELGLWLVVIHKLGYSFTAHKLVLVNYSLARVDIRPTPFECPKLKSLSLNSSRLKNFILGPTSDLEILSLIGYNLIELRMPSRRLNLRSLDLCHSKLRTLDIELTPNLERLNLKDCLNLTEINAPVGCLKKLMYLNLSGCGRFKSFLFDKQSKLLEVGSLSELHLIAESKDRDSFQSVKDLSNLLFTCLYKEDPAASSFGNLEKLISIGFSSCTNLKSFSRIIFSLQCLKKLTLEASITEVPKDIHQLQCLEDLCLSSAMIKHLPNGLCMLKQLKSLKLKGIGILEKLPKDFGQLESLQELCLSSAKIKHLPDGLCMLKQLKSLDLYCDDLEKLPNDFGKLESLQELCLSGAKIKHLPDGLCMLKQLKSLKLEWCKDLKSLPEDFGKLESLEKLKLSGTGISRLPDCISMLKNLKCLEIRWLRPDQKLLEDLGRLHSLEKLIFWSGKNYGGFSKSIFELKCLRYFQLHDYTLDDLPEELGHLKCLEELDITGTKICRLPQSIFQLKGLRIIGLKTTLELCGLTPMKRTSDIGDYETFCYTVV